MKIESRKYSFLLFIALYCMLVHSQESVNKIEYRQGIKNTYRFEAVDSSIVVSNVNNPFKGLSNDVEWRDLFTIDQISGDSEVILKNTLKPYLKGIDISDIPSDMFLIYTYFDLNGKLQFLEFAYSQKINIPLEAFEILESKLKKYSRLKLRKYSSINKDLNYIRLIGTYQLSNIIK